MKIRKYQKAGVLPQIDNTKTLIPIIPQREMLQHTPSEQGSFSQGRPITIIDKVHDNYITSNFANSELANASRKIIPGFSTFEALFNGRPLKDGEVFTMAMPIKLYHRTPYKSANSIIQNGYRIKPLGSPRTETGNGIYAVDKSGVLKTYNAKYGNAVVQFEVDPDIITSFPNKVDAMNAVKGGFSGNLSYPSPATNGGTTYVINPSDAKNMQSILIRDLRKELNKQNIMPTKKILDFFYKGALAGNPEYFNQAVGMPEHYAGQQDPTTEGATQLASNLKDIGVQGA